MSTSTSTYTIGEVSDRTGFTPSALRYYEGIGLVSPVERTEAGYRMYDDDTLSRLAFVARAKQLGCSLDEIAELAGLWDGERCGPVQRRLHELVTEKIALARLQTADLSAFSIQLRAAATRLGSDPIDGPCAESCACLTDAETPPEPPIACTLSPEEVPTRADDWQTVLAHVRDRVTTGDGALRLELDAAVPIDELTRLVAAEQRCCAFFAFAITVDDRGIGLEVHAPEAAGDVVASLFGRPDEG